MYSKENLVKIAKRLNNSRRTYLLVNPLQAKHIPTKPSETLAMMQSLAEKVKAICGEKKLMLIGFAETATAISAVISNELGKNCSFVHTTREVFENSNGRFLNFLEEHSHAVDQSLCIDLIEGAESSFDMIIMVDDEISTGKTILNMIEIMKKKIPDVSDAKFLAVSIINRMNAGDKARFKENGIETLALLDIENRNYDEELRNIDVIACNESPKIQDAGENETLIFSGKIDPRLGTKSETYSNACKKFCESAIETIKERIFESDKMVILGTEEFMYPAIELAFQLEKLGYDIRCHATTRSPICPASNVDYPIHEAFKISSFYDKDRINYVYNIENYDKAIVLTDSQADVSEALKSLAAIFNMRGCSETICVRWVN